MFVAATLYSGAGSCPVNVRNMSLSGALIEGAVLPDLDEPVTLRRGSLEAQARIVWRVDRKAGVAFSATVHIADWLSRKADSHQARVDDMVRGIRSGSDQPEPALSAPRPASINATAHAELAALKADLMKLENGLTNDVILVATHPEIQLLDIALQRVDRLLKGTPGF